MFSNRFNTRNDPLLEAAAAAMKDGDVRRQAEAFVNEQFGVYSRKAVVREELAAYDAALEEAYGALKEGVQLDELKKPTPETAFRVVDRANNRDEWSAKAANRLYSRYKKAYEPKEKKTEVKEETAKKDYDKDGKIESPKDEVWGSRLRAAKMAGKLKEEEQIDEMAHKALTAAGYKAGPKDSTTGFGRTYTKGKKSVYVDADGFARHGSGSKATVTHGNKETAAYLNRGKKMDEEQIDERNLLKRMKDTMRLGSSGKERVDRISGALSDRGGNWDYKKGDFTEKGKSQVKSRLKNVKGASDYALNKEETQMDESAYSAKAARAGKDIGKPGKQFSKIAKSAGKRYGSEERGKKVAGAILARIRAKHMKEENLEELSAFGKEFAAARSAGKSEFSFGGKSFNTKMASSAAPKPTTSLRSGPMNRISPAPKASPGSSSSAIPGVNPGISTRQAAQGTTIKQSGGFSTDAPKPSAGNYPDRGNVATGKDFNAIDKATNAAADKSARERVQKAVAGTDYAKPSKTSSGSKYDAGSVHNKTTLNTTAPGQQATVQSKTTEKGWADPGRWENEAKAKTGSMQQIRGGKLLPPSSQLGTPKSEVSRQSFLNKELGSASPAVDANRNVPTPASVGAGSRPSDLGGSPTTPGSMKISAQPAPVSGPSGEQKMKTMASLKEEVQIGDYKYRII